jgi:hypothetical protein
VGGTGHFSWRGIDGRGSERLALVCLGECALASIKMLHV